MSGQATRPITDRRSRCRSRRWSDGAR